MALSILAGLDVGNIRPELPPLPPKPELNKRNQLPHVIEVRCGSRGRPLKSIAVGASWPGGYTVRRRAKGSEETGRYLVATCACKPKKEVVVDVHHMIKRLRNGGLPACYGCARRASLAAARNGSVV